MPNYRTFTELTDNGPYITKLILSLPCEVGENDVTRETFHVYAECRHADSGEVAEKKENRSGRQYPLKGYPDIAGAYPCDENGTRQEKGRFAALELAESYLNKRILGDILTNEWLDNFYRVTQLRELPGGDSGPVCGMVFEVCEGDVCPQRTGWETAVSDDPELSMNYAFYTPDAGDGKLPLLIWLHGAGEGGTDVRIVYTGNKVTALSARDIQQKLGGAAWVLVPQCPTVWMDDGAEKLGRSNESIYVRPLKRLIDSFIAAYSDQIDLNRIYIGGLSNGGFMTVRMLRDYPDFFAGAIAVCAPWYQENISEQMLDAVKRIPLWFVHCKTDTLVPLRETALPLYHALKNAGAENVHFTLFDTLEDLSGRYHEPNGRPRQYFGHCVWIHAYNDDCKTDLDGMRVLENGEPVTLWEWLGMQTKLNKGQGAVEIKGKTI